MSTATHRGFRGVAVAIDQLHSLRKKRAALCIRRRIKTRAVFRSDDRPARGALAMLLGLAIGHTRRSAHPLRVSTQSVGNRRTEAVRPIAGEVLQQQRTGALGEETPAPAALGRNRTRFHRHQLSRAPTWKRRKSISAACSLPSPLAAGALCRDHPKFHRSGKSAAVASALGPKHRWRPMGSLRWRPVPCHVTSPPARSPVGGGSTAMCARMVCTNVSASVSSSRRRTHSQR